MGTTATATQYYHHVSSDSQPCGCRKNGTKAIDHVLLWQILVGGDRDTRVVRIYPSNIIIIYFGYIRPTTHRFVRPTTTAAFTARPGAAGVFSFPGLLARHTRGALSVTQHTTRTTTAGFGTNGRKYTERVPFSSSLDSCTSVDFGKLSLLSEHSFCESNISPCNSRI